MSSELGRYSRMVVLGSGKSLGLYAIGFARRVGPAGHAAAFEPNPASYTRLASMPA